MVGLRGATSYRVCKVVGSGAVTLLFGHVDMKVLCTQVCDGLVCGVSAGCARRTSS